MLFNSILHMIIFQMIFILIINKNYKIESNNLTNIFKIF